MALGGGTAVEALARHVSEHGAEELFRYLDADEQRQLARVMRQARTSERDRGNFFKLYPEDGPFARRFYSKHLEHFRMGKTARERCVMGGNRTGKTEMGAFETTAHATGLYPDWWEGRKFNEPIEAWVAGKTNETVRDIVQAKLFGRVTRNERGQNIIRGGGTMPMDRIVPDTVTFKTGTPRLLNEVGIRYRDSETEYSIIGQKAYEQGRGSFEGTAKHVVWLDEECPIEVYSECLIRTGSVDGTIYLTFTPLDGMTDTVVQFLSEELRPPSEDEESEWVHY